MRSTIAVAVVVATLVAVALGLQAFAPYASIATVSLVGAAAGTVVSVPLAWWARDRSQRRSARFYALMAFTLVFWCGGGGALASGVWYRMHHEELGVYNGHAAKVEIVVDGHSLGTIAPGTAGTFQIPRSAGEVTALEGGRVVDRANLDAAVGAGNVVFDVGGASCFAVRTVHYSNTPFGQGPSQRSLTIGDAHVFRADTDRLWDTPSEVRSKESSETRTILVRDVCGNRSR
jgi:hypothetical protein